ncbi:hypothetical protein RRG08_037307 [Elysia crispata]|uniref:Uncharacterized protein n=1 Tax=Elysia crispata TaxID=231223 RepID=A0AAE1AFU3_9GAST|nr:hypothetical protein RRG08_037307 [Elysia crispata]
MTRCKSCLDTGSRPGSVSSEREKHSSHGLQCLLALVCAIRAESAAERAGHGRDRYPNIVSEDYLEV